MVSYCLRLWVTLDLLPISTVIPPVSRTRALCWRLQHSHGGVEIFCFLFFFLLFFLNSCLLIKDCQSLGRIPDVPTVMSILVQYLRKLDVKIIHVIPAEGVPVDSHTHTHTHTHTRKLRVKLHVRCLAGSLCRPWRQSQCDNESVV